MVILNVALLSVVVPGAIMLSVTHGVCCYDECRSACNWANLKLQISNFTYYFDRKAFNIATFNEQENQ
jgi:hypothetical protein